MLQTINKMVFKIGVQAFSNINKIVQFDIDMTKPNAARIQPDQSVIDEIEYMLNNSSSCDNDSVT